MAATGQGSVTFGVLLRRLRDEAGLTQEELAETAGVSSRSISDLERGVNLTARKDTARLLANALGLTGPAKAEFEAAARGRTPASGPAVGGAPAATRTLPRDIASFTGRGPELQQLVDAAVDVASSASVVGIHAIGGMAGIGKTAFAVHAAHQLTPSFPDGQIFLPLHGHTPGQRPVDPADALASLLQTAGVAAARIPPGLEARIALWRDWLAGKQLLLVLDDAANSEQVQPLLPGAAGSLVLVTSRRHLTALEDAKAVSLGTLSAEEAAALLVRLADRPGLSPDDASVSELTRLCGYLPLAVGMLARQLHHHPAWTAADLVTDLAAAHDKLELMATENLTVAAAFNLSYQDLTEGQRRLFRRLGLHPGTDLDAYAAAALNGSPLAEARRLLTDLYDHYLLTEPARGRYRLHDLIRAYARTLAARDDPGSDRDRATSRLLDYYQYTAEIADRQLTRYARPAIPPTIAAPPIAPDLPGSTQALSWARAERTNLFACLDYVTRAGQHARVTGLTAASASILRHDGPWAEAIDRHATAAQAACHLGDQLAEANALADLGVVRELTGDYPGAAETLKAALGSYRDLGSRQGQANALLHLGIVRRRTAEYAEAVAALEAALGGYRDVGDQQGEANALIYLGTVREMTGEYRSAVEALETALGICRDLGDRLGQANALMFLGMARRSLGRYRDGIDALEAALGMSRDLGDRQGQANALNELGVVRRMTGDYRGAAEAGEAALDIYRQIGNRVGQGNALTYLEFARRMMGDQVGAAEAGRSALEIYRDLGDRGGEVTVLNELGTLCRVGGDLRKATEFHQQALDLAAEIGCRWDEANALAGLGRCALAGGRAADARAGLQQALEILQQINAGEAADVSAELKALDAGSGR